MKCFFLENNHICYISILHNLAFPDYDSSFCDKDMSMRDRMKLSFSANLCEALVEFISSKSSDFFIIDLAGINGTKEREVFHPFIASSASLILVNCSADIQNEISRELCVESPKTHVPIYSMYEGNKVFAKESIYSAIMRIISKKNVGITDYINDLPQNLLGDFVIKKCLIPKIILLPSSNVYANAYINIKALFADHLYYSYAIVIMHMRVSAFLQHFQDERICLVCASNNGAIIMENLSETFDALETIDFISVGPQVALHSPQNFDKLSRETCYVFIYDFLCLGTELKMTRLLCTLKEAKIVGSFGIAEYADPNCRSGNSRFYGALVHVCRLSLENMYCVAATPEDLNKLTSSLKKEKPNGCKN